MHTWFFGKENTWETKRRYLVNVQWKWRCKILFQAKIQGEHKVFPRLQAFITRKLCGIQIFLTCICLMAGGLLVKTWRQSVRKCDVRPSHDVMSECKTKKRFVKWLHVNAHPAARISQYDNSHPVPIRCFWILLEFRNTIVRVRSRVICDMIFGR